MKRANGGLPFWQFWGRRPEESPGKSLPREPEITAQSKSLLVTAFRMFVVLTLMTGGIYPLVVTLIANTLFLRRANGSVVNANGKIVGSELLAQNFTNSAYFWPRPSAGDFATVPSAASNKGPTASDLKSNVTVRAASLRAAHRFSPDVPAPSEMLFASASGLDPHISPETARLQIERVAQARKFSPEQKQKLAALVEQFIEPPTFGLLGEPRVNVLKLNLALNQIH